MPSRPSGEPDAASAEARAEDEDAQWVESFLLTWPGKTYRVAASDDAREDMARDDAAREALTEAARTLIDRVLLEQPDAEPDAAPGSGRPS